MINLFEGFHGSTGRFKPRGLTLLYELFHGRQRDSTGARGFPLGPEGYYGDGRVPGGRRGPRVTERSKGNRGVPRATERFHGRRRKEGYDVRWRGSSTVDQGVPRGVPQGPD